MNSTPSAANYAANRDKPAVNATSKLSPYLAFGEVSHHWVWQQLRSVAWGDSSEFLRQLTWREYSIYQLYHHPHMVTEEADISSYGIAFRRDAAVASDFKAWCQGMTGYPLVDAGMRELYATGWMHNRVRMIVACFLTKNLLIHWLHGARWFHDTLVDACVANNLAGWQWIVKVMPYYRIFNPVLQSQKFDPEGVYIKTWVPELAHCSSITVHDPYQKILPAAKTGSSPRPSASQDHYPWPIVDYKLSRQRALQVYQSARQT